jgi:nitrate reductase NapE component
MATTPTHHRSAGAMAAATGLTLFAAVMLFISGVLAIFRGIMAIARDNVFVTTPNYVFKFDLTGWGWVHLVLGALAVVVSVGLFMATTWARVLGVAIASLLIIANFLTIPYYPVWSLTLIALYGFIIWALCVAPKDSLAP